MPVSTGNVADAPMVYMRVEVEHRFGDYAGRHLGI
jgi:hypothetical protein